MHLKKITTGTCTALVLTLSFAVGSPHVSVFAQSTQPTANVAVEPQYDTTHVYVPPEDFARLPALLGRPEVVPAPPASVAPSVVDADAVDHRPEPVAAGATVQLGLF